MKNVLYSFIQFSVYYPFLFIVSFLFLSQYQRLHPVTVHPILSYKDCQVHLSKCITYCFLWSLKYRLLLLDKNIKYENKKELWYLCSYLSSQIKEVMMSYICSQDGGNKCVQNFRRLIDKYLEKKF